MVTSLWQPKTNYQTATNHWTSTASHGLRHAGHDKFSSVAGQTLATYGSDCIKLTHKHLSSFESCLSVTIRHKWCTKYSLFSFVDESINTSRRAWCHLIQPRSNSVDTETDLVTKKQRLTSHVFMIERVTNEAGFTSTFRFPKVCVSPSIRDKSSTCTEFFKNDSLG